MEYIRGKFKQMIFESDNGYKVGLFRIKETNQEEKAKKYLEVSNAVKR